LAALYRLLNRDAEALRETHEATVAARKADIPILLAMSLASEASALIRCEQSIEAGALIAEGFSIISADKAFKQIRARFLTLRAECAIQSSQLADAESELSETFGVLQPLSAMDFAAGVHTDLARWWRVTAILRNACDDMQGAVAAWREGVSAAKHVATLPQCQDVYVHAAVADMLTGLATALTAVGREKDAQAALAERKTILTNLGLPAERAATRH
jgi:hypothetical protein